MQASEGMRSGGRDGAAAAALADSAPWRQSPHAHPPLVRLLVGIAEAARSLGSEVWSTGLSVGCLRPLGRSLDLLVR